MIGASIKSKMNIAEYGKPRTVLKFNQDDKSFQDDSFMLRNLFLEKEVKDRKVVVFSIVGSFRKGKSFFLDYCLRYLYANYDSLNRENKKVEKDFHWMGHQNDKLNGFSWRSGAERDTTGIIFWSDVFLYTNNSNEKFAIFVVDTQGLFDNETTLMENSQIFALSSLISSIQVINLNGNIREDELNYFQFAMEFSKLAKNDGNKSKEFQKLVFLVRDWQSPDDYDFGEVGGTKYLKNVLEIKPKQNEELNSVREFISKSCEEVTCHLLPHPGKNVAGRNGYNGQWSLMDEDFRYELFDSIENLLNPDNLIVKKVCGRQLSAENFFVHLQAYFKYFVSNEIPKVATMYKLLVEKDLDFLVEKAFMIFEKKLASFENRAETEAQIDNFIKISKELGVSDFRNEQKLGDSKCIESAENKLTKMIESHYKKWRTVQLKFLNDQKAINKLKVEAELKDKALEYERTKSGTKDQKITELCNKIQAESEDKVRIFKSLNEKLATEKEKYEDSLKSERSNYKSALAEKESQNAKLQNKISEMKQRNSQMSRNSSVCDSGNGLTSILSGGYSSGYSGGSGNELASILSGGYSSGYSGSYAPSVSSVSSSSSRAVNPWNQYQQQFSSVWRGMSASEKRSAGGNFQTACSRSYRSRK